MARSDVQPLNAFVDVQLAHDFNNLLGVILNYTTLVRRVVDDPTGLSDLDEISAAAERAALLTRQIVTFSSEASDG